MTSCVIQMCAHSFLARKPEECEIVDSHGLAKINLNYISCKTRSHRTLAPLTASYTRSYATLQLNVELEASILFFTG